MSFIFDPQRGEQPKRRADWHALIRQPRDVGQGMAAIGDALAYRHAQRQVPGGAAANPFARIGNGLKGLFGLGANRSGLY